MADQRGSNDLPRRREVTSKLKRTPEEYIKERVQFKINNYSNKSDRYRWIYQLMASFAAVGAALVPVLINLPAVDTLYPTILSFLVAAIVALEGVWHPREHWRNYDLISSLLREEEMRFSTEAPPYSPDAQNPGEKVRFNRFVERVEDAIAKERVETIGMRTTASETTPQPGGGRRTEQLQEIAP